MLPFAVHLPLSHAVHVLFVQLYLYQALQVNPHVVADVHLLVQLYLFVISVHALHDVEVLHDVVYVPLSHAVHVLADLLYLYHALHVKSHVVADVPAVVQLHLLAILSVHALHVFPFT